MNFETKEINKNFTFENLVDCWSDTNIDKDELSIEIEWLKNKQENNNKYAIYDADEKNYPMIYETTNVNGKYLKSLKIKHAPYMLDKFYESMNFDYITKLYKYLIEDFISHSNKKNIDEFRIYIDNDNTIAVLAFQLFAQLLLPDNYKSKFSSCRRWLFVERIKN
jgi:hypothetical protein